MLQLQQLETQRKPEVHRSLQEEVAADQFQTAQRFQVPHNLYKEISLELLMDHTRPPRQQFVRQRDDQSHHALIDQQVQRGIDQQRFANSARELLP